MQMRSGDPARCAYSADAGAGCDTIAGCDFDRTEVRIQRKKTSAVVEYHGISRKKVIADIDHLRFAGGDDRRAIRRGNVHAIVGIARLAVEEAPLSERIGA